MILPGSRAKELCRIEIVTFDSTAILVGTSGTVKVGGILLVDEVTRRKSQVPRISVWRWSPELN
jgi:hypothetical protein